MEKQSYLPKDTSLPFLAYGIFKPFDLSGKIELINEESSIFENKNFITDIVPLKTKYGKNKNDSYLIYFDKDYSKEAYEIISNSESIRPVKWKKVKVGGIKANVLYLEGKKDSYFLNSPKDTSLPFFAYGIFKENQIAYSKIEKFVKEPPEDHYVNYEMLIRDGVPILTKEIDEKYKAKGHLIYFKDDCCDEAYKVISETEPRKLYYWDVIKVNEEDANVLFGEDPKKGSSKIEMYKGEIKNYNGKNDPFFNESIKIIEEFIKKPYEVNVNNLMELQMHYLLLWAAIERYCDLKYGKEKISENIEEFSNEKAVIESIKNLKNLNKYKSKTVFSAKDLRDYELNPKEPYDSLRFFYTIRCNVVHRGKIIIYDDSNLLVNSLVDLFEIFENVLKDTFKED